MPTLNSEQDNYIEQSTTVEVKVTAEAFDRYYEQYSNGVYAFLNQYKMSQQDREDLLQEVFVKFWRNRSEIKTVEHVKFWLYKVARTTAIDFLEKKKVSNQHLESLEQLKDDNHFEIASVASEGLNWIYEALRNLPRGEREVIKWWLVDELTMKEIARIRETSVRTVYNQRSNGLAKLKDWFDQDPNAKTVLLLLMLNSFEDAL